MPQPRPRDFVAIDLAPSRRRRSLRSLLILATAGLIAAAAGGIAVTQLLLR